MVDESPKMAAHTTTNKRSLAAIGAIDELLKRVVPISPELSPKLARSSTVQDDLDPPLITMKFSAEKAQAVATRVSPSLETAVGSKREEENRATPPSSTMVTQEAAPLVPSLNQKRTAEERFTDAQAEERRRGKDASLKWTYCGDELTGATCGEVTFSREELLQLSSCWAGR